MEAILKPLAQLSATVGADERLVQGAGGNTSIKQGDTLWVKASGTWLQDAEKQAIFVPLSLTEVNQLLAAGEINDEALKKLRVLDSSGLAPSIETPLHALLPQVVVAHVHSVRTIAWAARCDAEQQLDNLLRGLSWSMVPYVRPGAPLANAVREVLERNERAVNVLVLANHGLVVGADNCHAAQQLIAEVESRLAGADSPPIVAGAYIPSLPPPEGYSWSNDPWVAGPAFHDSWLKIAEAGSLYPDHVVFLGPRARVFDHVEQLVVGPDCKLAFIHGVGTLLRHDLSPGALSMANCLGRVLAELSGQQSPSGDQLSCDHIAYLSTENEAELMGWDAEAYRNQLDLLRQQQTN